MPAAIGTGSASCRDRTAEFAAIVDRLKRSEQNGARPDLPKPPPMSLQSEFMHRASLIGKGIHQTSGKLHKLTQLAKKTSIFDDPVVEIQELTAVIRQDIQALNAAIVDLQNLRDSHNDGNRNKHSSEHSATVVENLKSKLMDATKEFKEVLTFRSESLKTQEGRMKQYSSASDKGHRRFGQGPVNGSTSRELFTRRRPGAESGASSSSSSSSLLGSQSQAQMQQLVPVQDSYLQSRAEALRNVESTIAELSNIFTQLATMVSEQGEIAIRIDEDMDNTLVNMDHAQSQLLKYLNSISSNRWLIVKIFFVLLVFLLVFVFFVA